MDDPELDIARACLEYEQEDQAALDWLATQAPQSYLLFAPGQPGHARPALASGWSGAASAGSDG